jgi:phage terminase small subunit
VLSQAVSVNLQEETETREPLALISEAHVAFCDEILKGASVELAFERAGLDGSLGSSAWLVRQPPIQAYLAARRIELRGRVGVTEEGLVRELSQMAFFDPAELLAQVIDEPRDIMHLPEHVRRAIKGWKFDRHGHLIVEFYSKTTAIELLGRHLGIFQKDKENRETATNRLLESVMWRWVLAQMITNGMPLVDAMTRAQDDPEVWRRWGIDEGLLLPSGDVG